MISLHAVQNVLLAVHQRCDGAVLVPFGDRPRLGHVVDDPPAAAVALQHQIDQAQMRAPKPAHGRRFAMNGARRHINRWHVGIAGRGEDLVMVARQHRVDAINRRQRDRGVFHPVAVICRTNARMAKGDDDVGPLFFHQGHQCAGRIHDIAGVDVAFKVAAVPVHDLGRDKADEAHLDHMRVSVAIRDRVVEDHEGRHEGFVSSGRAPLFRRHVCTHNREIRTREGFHQKIKAIVKFVIAQRGRIKAHSVHGCDDRMAVALFHAPLVSDVIAHRVALKEVAIVDQHGVGRLRPDAFDDRGRAGQTHRVTGPVGVVVVGKDMHMQVRGFHDPKMGLIAGGAQAERMQGRKGCGGGQKGPA
mmetsp:Transcript_23568/g.41670  ORF Transcript_23568/g.41670 Transcript_23568/m.41670 type:complete len:359 (+) Transcript_23568:1062-2138(+)